MLTNYLKRKFLKTIYTKEIDPAHTMKGHLTLFPDTGVMYAYLENLQRVHVNRWFNPLITTRLYPFQIPTVAIDLFIRMSELPDDDYVKFDFKAYRATMTDSINEMLTHVDENVPEQFRENVRNSLLGSVAIWADWDDTDKAVTDSLCNGGLTPLMKIKEGSHTRYVLASTYHGVLTLTALTVINLKTGAKIVDIQRMDFNKTFIQGILSDGLNIVAYDEPDTQERSDV